MSGRERAIWTRFSESEFAKLEDWRRAQPTIPPIAATVRTLVSAGLRASEMDGKLPAIKENAG